jgi:hypothetical protein
LSGNLILPRIVQIADIGIIMSDQVNTGGRKLAEPCSIAFASTSYTTIAVFSNDLTFNFRLDIA